MQTSGYLHLSPRPLYATWFEPDAGAPIRAGLVLYDPFGEEKKSAFRVMVRLARAAARRGVATLRFDLSGTGESAGDPAQATWEDWQADAEAAATWLAQRLAGQPWIAVGVRFGALLAVPAATRAGAAGLSLVEPILSGDACLRDLERRQLIKQAVASVTAGSEDSAARWARGEIVDFGGFEVGPDLARSLQAETLATRLGELPATCPVQVLRVSGATGFPPAWKSLTERAAAPPPGRATAVRDKPFWGQLEYYESDAVQEAVLSFVDEVAAAHGRPPEVSPCR